MWTSVPYYVKKYRVGEDEVIEMSRQGKIRRKFRHDVRNPSVITEDGTKMWYLNDCIHRDDGPAIIEPNGTKKWYCMGHLHREGGPAIEFSSGAKYYYNKGSLHRVDGPAIVSNEEERWYLYDGLHREGGPAIIRKPGYYRLIQDKTYKMYKYEWFYKGEPIHRSDHNRRKEKEIVSKALALIMVREVMECDS